MAHHPPPKIIIPMRVPSRSFAKRLLHFTSPNASQANPINNASVVVYGATGSVGEAMCYGVGRTGADLVFPFRGDDLYSDYVKKLRQAAPLGNYYQYNGFNFNDPVSVERSMRNCNIVINLVGARAHYRNYNRIYESNVTNAIRVAKQAKKNNVLRLIHFSAAGADRKSNSIDFVTKKIAEEAVLDIFPEATIIRPCTIIGENDRFADIFLKRAEMFWSFIPVYSDMMAKRQPILEKDLVLAVINALQMPETKGKIYELGGKHVYTIKELNEMMMNAINKPFNFLRLPHNLAVKFATFLSWPHFPYNDVVKEPMDIVVTRKNGELGLEDLFVKPGSVKGFFEDFFQTYRHKTDFNKDIIQTD